MDVPSPISANNTGLTTCSLWLVWKQLAGEKGTHLVGSWVGLEGVVVAPVTRGTRLMRCANCHCNRKERDPRRMNILDVLIKDIQQREFSTNLHLGSRVNNSNSNRGDVLLGILEPNGCSRLWEDMTSRYRLTVNSRCFPHSSIVSESLGHPLPVHPCRVPRQNY